MARDTGQLRIPRRAPKVTDVRVDIDDGPSVEISKDGPRAVRVARVYGLPGDGTARLWHALGATGVPKYGDLHPLIQGLPIGRVHAALEPGSTDIATVTCEYFYPTGGNMHFANIEDVRTAPMPQLEITSTVQPARTQFYYDAEGNKRQITLDWFRPPPEGEPGPPSPMPTQSGEVEYQLPMTVFRYMRREPADAYVGDKARDYVGAINSNTPMFGDLQHYWMCTRLDGVSDDAGQSYNVSYEFQRHPDTWNATVIYVDPQTGMPVPDPVQGESIKTVRIYRERNFEELNLDVPT